MSLIGKINELEEENEISTDAYTTPAVIRKDDEGVSFKKSLLLSTILHPSAVGLAWLIVIILMLMGVTFSIFEKPKPKMNDIEFVLVDKEATPINKNTKYRADKNSRAGGKHDPKRKVSMPSPAPAKTKKSTMASGTRAKKQIAQTKTRSNKSLSPKKSTTNKLFTKQAPRATQPSNTVTNAKPQPPSVRPSVRPPSAPRVVTNATSPFTAPVPQSARTGRMSTGPVGGTGGSSRVASGGGGAYSPKPSLSPSYGSGSGSGSRTSAGSSGGYGNSGNPGPGNPNGSPGIDALKEPDFGPYMRELQRRIKMNWDPPKGNESKRVVLYFKIAKNGSLLSSRVYKSSGLQVADRAALNAVAASAPFRPLPANFRGQSIDIQFTFDYNVFGASGYR